MRGFSQYLRRDERGSAVIEIALGLPVLLIIMFGIVEVGGFINLNIKMQNTALTVADLVARLDQVTEEDIDDIFEAAPAMLAPYNTDSESVMIISAIGRLGQDEPVVLWQRKGLGSLGQDSLFGREGRQASALSLALEENEIVIAAELHHRNRPIFGQFTSDQVIEKYAFFKIRRDGLGEIQ